MADNILKISIFDRTSRSDFRGSFHKMLAVGAFKEGFNEALTIKLDTFAGATNRNENITKNIMAQKYLTLTMRGTPALLLDWIASKDLHSTLTELNSHYFFKTINDKRESPKK